MSSMASWECQEVFQVTLKTTICLECIAIFRQDMSPLQLRCLSSVSNFSTSCHCQQSQGCCQTGALNFHQLHMFTTYHGTWSQDLFTSPSSWTNFADTRWTSSSFGSLLVLNQQRLLERMILQPQRKKNKYFETWNLFRHLCYTAWHIFTYIYIWYMYQFIYYVVCVCRYTYIYIYPHQRFQQTPFQTVTNLNWPKISDQTSQGSPRPLTHQKLGLGTMKYCLVNDGFSEINGFMKYSRK